MPDREDLYRIHGIAKYHAVVADTKPETSWPIVTVEGRHVPSARQSEPGNALKDSQGRRPINRPKLRPSFRRESELHA